MEFDERRRLVAAAVDPEQSAHAELADRREVVDDHLQLGAGEFLAAPPELGGGERATGLVHEVAGQIDAARDDGGPFDRRLDRGRRCIVGQQDHEFGGAVGVRLRAVRIEAVAHRQRRRRDRRRGDVGGKCVADVGEQADGEHVGPAARAHQRGHGVAEGRRIDAVAVAEPDEHLDPAARGRHVDLRVLRLEADQCEVRTGRVVAGLGIELVAEDPAGDDRAIGSVVVAANGQSGRRRGHRREVSRNRIMLGFVR